LLCDIDKVAFAFQFGKYSVRGAFELETRQERERTLERTSTYESFEHRYKLGIQSYVLSPRLLNYQIDLSLGLGKVKTNDDYSSIDDFGWRAQGEFLAGKSLNGVFYTHKETTERFAPLTSSMGSVNITQTNTAYGLMVNMNYPNLPTQINLEENFTEGTSGSSRIDRSQRQLQLNTEKSISGFNTRINYAYRQEDDYIETANTNREHNAYASLERAFSFDKFFRQELKFTIQDRVGKYQDITARTVTTTEDYIFTTADEIVRFDAVFKNLVGTLPSARGDLGRTFTVVKIDGSTNTVTLKPQPGETIGGALSLVLSTQWAEVTIISDGANWVIGERKKGTIVGGGRTKNYWANTFFSYRPTKDFSCENSLNFFLWDRENQTQKSIMAAHSTNYQVTPELSVIANINATVTDLNTSGRTDGENVSATINYDTMLSNWNWRLFYLVNFSHTGEPQGNTLNRGETSLGSTVSRDFPFWQSRLLFGAHFSKSADSRGGETTSTQGAITWNATPNERLNISSGVHYSFDDAKTTTVIVVGTENSEQNPKPYIITTHTASVDFGLQYLLYAAADKLITLNGGGILSRQLSIGTEGFDFTTDRAFFYGQLIFKAMLARNAFFSITTRGEWEESTFMKQGNREEKTNKVRTVYSTESSLNFRFRKVTIELSFNLRKEMGSDNPYERQSFYLKMNRPF